MAERPGSAMSLGHELQQLVAALDRAVAELVACAQTAGTPTTQWPAVLHSWTGHQHQALAQRGTGARPDELRWVLLALVGRFEQHADVLAQRIAAQPEDDDALEDRVWELRHRRLAQLVETELPRYIRLVAPSPSLGSIFANAGARAAFRPAPVAAPQVQTIQCKGCGSPRQHDNLYGRCHFCGTPFFEKPSK